MLLKETRCPLCKKSERLVEVKENYQDYRVLPVALSALSKEQENGE